MSINGVFFDLYGTLLIYNEMFDVWSDFVSEFYVCLQSQGLSIPKETFAGHCERFFDKDEPPEREDSLTVFERRIRALCSELGVNVEVADVKHIATTIVNSNQQRHYLDPDCYPVLEALRQQPKTLALISNYDHPPHVHAFMEKLGLESLVLGHEITGDIVELGDKVKNLKVGDRVFVSHHVPCFECHHCELGHHTACHLLHNTNYDPGGFAEYLKVPNINIENKIVCPFLIFANL